MDNINDKIRKIARLKEENPEAFNRVVKENLEKNPAFNQIMDAVPLENTKIEPQLTWLDKKIMQDRELTAEDISEMCPKEKVELYLNSEGIYGYTDSIIEAVSTAYGLELEKDNC